MPAQALANRIAPLLALVFLLSGPHAAFGQTAGTKSPSEQQSQFCSILENAKSRYQALSARKDAAQAQRHGIIEQQLSNEMASVHRSRDQSIFNLLNSTQFRFKSWQVVLLEIGKPSSSEISLKFQPCALSSILHATTAMTPANLSLLVEKKTGDRVFVSGAFVTPYTSESPKSAADKFERSISEHGSIDEPEYTAIGIQFEP